MADTAAIESGVISEVVSEVDNFKLYHSHRAVLIWLLASCAFVYLMVFVGGVTRLTDSGLSMVHWHPVHGIIPPLNEAEWLEEFSHYQQSPEYLKVNHGMSVEEFKSIFFWEYSHRLLGRLAGLVFFLPLVVFAVKRVFHLRFMLRLVAIFLLGGAQGLMGWYMVKSGLVDRPDVSQYRLTAHLMLAVALFSLLLWSALDVWREWRGVSGVRGVSHVLGWCAIGVVLVQMALGALVAGLNAGMIYNTYPLMNGQLIPDELWPHSSWYMNVGEDILSVQFHHRMMAWVVVVSVLMLWWKCRHNAWHIFYRKACTFLPVALILQVVLGIATLLYVVPLPLAVMHQVLAIALLASIIIVTHGLREKA